MYATGTPKSWQGKIKIVAIKCTQFCNSSTLPRIAQILIQRSPVAGMEHQDDAPNGVNYAIGRHRHRHQQGC